MKQEDRSMRKWELDTLVWTLPDALGSTLHNGREGQGEVYCKRDVEDVVESVEATGYGIKGSLFKLLWRLEKWAIVGGSLLGVMRGFQVAFLTPLLLERLVSSQGIEQLSYGLALSASLTLDPVILAFSKQLLGTKLCSKFAILCSTLVLKKSTRLEARVGRTHQSREEALVGTDISRIVDDILLCSSMVSDCAALLSAASFLAWKVQLAALAGFGAVLLLSIVPFTLFSHVSKHEKIGLSLMDERVNLIRTFLTHANVAKSLCWEDLFQERIRNLRVKECKEIRTFRVLDIISRNWMDGSVVVGACVCVVSFILLSQTASSGISAILIVVVFTAIRGPMFAIPRHIVRLSNMYVSMRRIETFLSLPEFSRCNRHVPASILGGNALIARDVLLRRPSSHHGNELNTFQVSISTLNVPSDGLVGIVGYVGAGSSTLLEGMFGGAHLVSGSLQFNPKTAYVPEEPLLFGGSLVENITVGLPYDHARFNRIIKAVALDEDSGLFQNEHGQVPYQQRGKMIKAVTELSGGQQARVCLARALYRLDTELLVLDDPFRALDPRVTEHCFERVLLCLLHRCKCRGTYKEPECLRQHRPVAILMSCKQHHLFCRFDQLLVLDRGTVLDQGTPSELSQRPAFSALMRRMLVSAAEATVDESRDASKCKAPLVDVDVEMKKVEIDDSVSLGLSDVEELDLEKGSFIDVPRMCCILCPSTSHLCCVVSRYVAGMGVGWTLLATILVGTGSALGIAGEVLLGRAVDNSERSDESLFSSSRDLIFLFVGFELAQVIGCQVGSTLNAFSGARASVHFHDLALARILEAPAAYLESKSSGRILSMFSNDLSTLDRQLPDQFDYFIVSCMLLLSVIICASVLVPSMVAVFFIILLGASAQVIAFNSLASEARKETSLTISPILDNLSDAIAFRLPIRAMSLDSFFFERHFERTATWTSSIHRCGSYMNANTFFFAAPVLFVALVCTTFISISDDIPKGTATVFAQLTMVHFVTLSMYFLNCLPALLVYFHNFDRVLRSSLREKTPAELGRYSRNDDILQARHWPTSPSISFEDVTLIYAPGAPPALSHVSFDIKASERVGIVGRTGSGKSSIFQLLLGHRQPTSGVIRVDGVDLASVGLVYLRDHVFATVPQNPILFPGTLRENVDPALENSPEAIEKVLQNVGLGRPDIDVLTLSFGERQRLSLARVLLRKHKSIVLLDEVITNPDHTLHGFIRAQLADLTVCTITHNLETLNHFERVLVMDGGKLLAFDEPKRVAQVLGRKTDV